MQTHAVTEIGKTKHFAFGFALVRYPRTTHYVARFARKEVRFIAPKAQRTSTLYVLATLALLLCSAQ